MDQREEAIRAREVTPVFPGQIFIVDGLEFWLFPRGSILYRGNEPDKGDRYLWLGQLQTALYYASEDTSLVYCFRTMEDMILLVMNERNLRTLQSRFPSVSFFIDHVSGIGLRQQELYHRQQPEYDVRKRRMRGLLEIHTADFFSNDNKNYDVYANARLALQLQKVLPGKHGWIYPYKLHPEATDAQLFDDLYDPEVMIWRASSDGLVALEYSKPAVELDE